MCIGSQPSWIVQYSPYLILFATLVSAFGGVVVGRLTTKRHKSYVAVLFGVATWIALWLFCIALLVAAHMLIPQAKCLG
jgi:hypothetical protein